jgi:hypothetical protein
MAFPPPISPLGGCCTSARVPPLVSNWVLVPTLLTMAQGVEDHGRWCPRQSEGRRKSTRAPARLRMARIRCHGTSGCALWTSSGIWLAASPIMRKSSSTARMVFASYRNVSNGYCTMEQRQVNRHVEEDSLVSVMYSEELTSSKSSSTLQRTDRHRILGILATAGQLDGNSPQARIAYGVAVLAHAGHHRHLATSLTRSHCHRQPRGDEIPVLRHEEERFRRPHWPPATPGTSAHPTGNTASCVRWKDALATCVVLAPG